MARGTVSQHGKREFDLANTKAFTATKEKREDRMVVQLHGLDKNDVVCLTMDYGTAGRLLGQITNALKDMWNAEQGKPLIDVLKDE